MGSLRTVNPTSQPALTDFRSVLDFGGESECMMHSPSELSICGEHYEE